jgi:hypothetical protein
MQRDFVVQIRPDADVRTGQLEGRVEHIDSARSTHFKTLEELVDFISRSIHADATHAEDLTSL